MTIKVLENSVINKIAAGEVIERPANVIKELLENALDANATEIKIEIEDAGLGKIKVSDNGVGMSREDVLIAYKRHATSKIENAEDLEGIHSLGFRGEALSSIAEVSSLVIKSKTHENEVGYFIKIEGGIVLENDKIGCSNGTSIEISNLFYNVPARKKFLKTNEVELAHSIDIVTRYALIKKEVAITLIHNNKEIINSQKTENELNNIIYIYGTDITKSLIEVDYRFEDIHITGYISKPNLTRANKYEQSIYVNERYVSSPVITEAIYSGYKTLLFNNRHPICILNIKTDPKNFDVNIHPNKLEIRFKNEQEIYDSTYNAIKNALGNHILVPEAQVKTIPIDTNRKPTMKMYEQTVTKQSNLFQDNENKESAPINEYPEQIKQKEAFAIQDSAPEEPQDPFSTYKILGQINKTFIVCETELGTAFIDQHAAEERVNYEKFLSELKEGAIKKQTLLQSEIIELNPIQMQIAIDQKALLDKLGYSFDEFGGNAIKLNSNPEIFGRLKPQLFLDIINELLKINTKLIEEEIENRIIRFACKASIKSGDELTTHEMQTLLSKLGRCENPYTCPHGRPTVVQLTIADLERMFKRS